MSHSVQKALSRRKRLVSPSLDTAPQSEEHAVTEPELYERAGAIKRSTARPALLELVANGALVCTLAEGEKGKKGNPARYWRPAGPRILSVETRGVPTERILTTPPTVGGEDAPVSGEMLSAGTPISIEPAAFPAETGDLGGDVEEPLPWQ